MVVVLSSGVGLSVVRRATWFHQAHTDPSPRMDSLARHTYTTQTSWVALQTSMSGSRISRSGCMQTPLHARTSNNTATVVVLSDDVGLSVVRRATWFHQAHTDPSPRMGPLARHIRWTVLRSPQDSAKSLRTCPCRIDPSIPLLSPAGQRSRFRYTAPLLHHADSVALSMNASSVRVTDHLPRACHMLRPPPSRDLREPCL